jgi:sulfate/thiosulfate transport system permease protein
MNSIYYPKKFKLFILYYSIVSIIIIVVLPLGAIFFKSISINFLDFFTIITGKRFLSALRISLMISFFAAIINTFLGLICAYSLVRYDFIGKKFIDSLIDFPMALPTTVAGLTYSAIYSKKNSFGQFIFNLTGYEILYTEVIMILILVFVAFPFTVRSIQPVLSEMDEEQIIAARSLGANQFQIFRYIIFPEILPGLISGFTLSFARGLGEYGSIIFVSANLPNKSEILPLLIVNYIEEFNYVGAAAIAITMLSLSFAIIFLLNLLERRFKSYE